MTIRRATGADYGRWDAFLDQFPHIPPLQRFAWGTVLVRAYGVPTVFLIAEQRGTVCGICPLYVITDPAGVRRAFSLRYGLVAVDDRAAHALLVAARDAAAELHCASVLIATGHRVLTTGEDESTRRTVRYAVAANEDAAWASLRNKTRNMVRKARRSGVVVRDGRPDDITKFARVYAERMCRRGIPTHTVEFFAAILRAFPERAELLIAERYGMMLGGMVLCTGAQCATYPFQVTIPGSEMHAPTALLTWEAIRRCSVRGIAVLDMGESRASGAVEAAKLHFGGTVHDIHYVALAVTPMADARVLATFAIRAVTLGMRYAPLDIASRCGVWLKQHGRIM